jgi:tetratricopeptide (TPR) repeat protein
LLKLMKSSPKNAEYTFLLGRVEENANELKSAAAQYRKTLELDPAMVRAYENLARVQEKLGLAAEARKTYEAGVMRNRTSATPSEWPPLDLAVVLLKTGENAKAEELIRESLLYKPRFALAHYYLGDIFQKKGKNDEAVTEYKAAVVAEPRLREAWLALSELFTKMGNKDEAEKSRKVYSMLESEDKAREGKK